MTDPVHRATAGPDSRVPVLTSTNPAAVRAKPDSAATRAFRAAAVALAGVALFWHARETVLQFSLDDPQSVRLPFTMNDHPLHYYYSQITAEFFAGRRSFWGYDPHFMAGYAKTMIFPTGCTLPELVAIVFGKNSPQAFRVFVASCVFLPPIFLGLAARTLAGRWSAAMLAFCLGVLWVWCGWPVTYVTWGMAPFVVGITSAVWGAILLADWLDSRSRWSLVAGTLVATFATIAHPCSPVILALMLLPAYVSCVRVLGWREHAIAWLVPLVVLACWSPWWLPAWQLRDTFGTTETGFVNEKILARLMELAQLKYPEETALFVAGVASAWALRGLGCAKFFAVASGAILFFVINYFGGAIRAIWMLQPGRYSQPLYAVLLVASAVAWPRIVPTMLDRASWRGSKRFVTAIQLLCLTGAVGLGTSEVITDLVLSERPILQTTLPPPIQDLIALLRETTDSSGRILFEDRGKSKLGRKDPFPDTNPSALLPILAPGQYIGGPYLYTHLKSNFTQVGDGDFFTRSYRAAEIPLDTFERYADLYNIRWVVLWSAPLTRLAHANPDQFQPLAKLGYLEIFELARESNWAIVGSAQVVARLDRLEVLHAAPDAEGTLVLSYHWIPTLRSSATLRPVYLDGDPVPFIGVVDPPPSFVIENRLW